MAAWLTHLYTPEVRTDTLNRIGVAVDFDKLHHGRYYDEASHSGSPIAILTEGGGAEHFEGRTGLPQSSAWMIEAIFRGLPLAESGRWCLHFFESIPADTFIDSEVFENNMLVWQLDDATHGMVHLAKSDEEADFITAVRNQIARLSGDEKGWKEVMAKRPQRASLNAAVIAACEAAEAVLDRNRCKFRAINRTKLFGLNAAAMLRSAADAAAAGDVDARHQMVRAQAAQLLHCITHSPPANGKTPSPLKGRLFTGRNPS